MYFPLFVDSRHSPYTFTPTVSASDIECCDDYIGVGASAQHTIEYDTLVAVKVLFFIIENASYAELTFIIYSFK